MLTLLRWLELRLFGDPPDPTWRPAGDKPRDVVLGADDVRDMRRFWFVRGYLVWTGRRFPWVHIRRSRRNRRGGA